MAATDPPAGRIKEERLAPGYVFFGEEDYLADEFIRKLKESLMTPDSQGFNLERFDLAVTGWPDIIDTARTVPFFFSPWRIVVVRAIDDGREAKENRKGKEGSGKLSALDEKIIRDYFRSPAARTVLVVMIVGRVKKTHPVIRFFDSLPRGTVVLKEAKRLRQKELEAWMMQRLASLGKSAALPALARLEEVAGNDLRLIDRELEKVAAFAADRKTIDIEDVLQVCGWTKGFIEWDLADALKRADERPLLLTLNRAFQEGEKPENIMRVFANFFRDLLLAKLWLREGRDRKEIFAFLKPQIKETWSLYATEFRALFSLLERLSLREINGAIRELENIDVAVKTMDISEQALIERFVIEYCRRQRPPSDRPGITWREKG